MILNFFRNTTLLLQVVDAYYRKSLELKEEEKPDVSDGQCEIEESEEDEIPGGDDEDREFVVQDIINSVGGEEEEEEDGGSDEKAIEPAAPSELPLISSESDSSD